NWPMGRKRLHISRFRPVGPYALRAPLRDPAEVGGELAVAEDVEDVAAGAPAEGRYLFDPEARRRWHVGARRGKHRAAAEGRGGGGVEVAADGRQQLGMASDHRAEGGALGGGQV